MSFLDGISQWFASPPTPVSLWDDLDAIASEQAQYLLGSETVEAKELQATYPPVVEHEKKKFLFSLALAEQVKGEISVERYQAFPLPTTSIPFEHQMEIVAQKGYFKYSSNDMDQWFMNFAHHDLFCCYGQFMFAQDEIQVSEHPSLASLREMMLTHKNGLIPRTVEHGNPTPVLIRGVKRTLDIDTSQIYGARFARSDENTIRESVRPLNPATSSNILAIEAPIASGNSIYTRSEIEYALRTAYSGFRAVVLNSLIEFGPAKKQIALHTGFWGCGAYGGNRRLMITLQMIAAQLAGIHKLYFHVGADKKEEIAEHEHFLRSQLKFQSGIKVASVLDKLAASKFPWGTPDGN